MDIFTGISLTIVIAAVISGILYRLKQPMIIGHILTGLIVGPFLFKNLQFQEVVNSMSSFGIALLLFIIGLNLTPKVIREVGRVSLLSGLGQIFITSVAGFFVCRWLGFSQIVSLYLALALTFSSTIIIMKLLSDKRELTKLHSKISIGMLLIQDFLVAALLIGITAFSGGIHDWRTIILTLLRGIIVLDLIVIFTVYILPLLSEFFAKSQEFLFLFAMAWGLGLAAIFHLLGFSMEIGALIAGVALSTSPYHFEMSSKLKPLRDFFIILFFIILGSKITLPALIHLWYPVLILTIFVIAVKPILALILTGSLGYKKKVNFMTAINFTQLSEFSLILLLLAQTLGHVPAEIISMITIVSLITIGVSSYLVLFAGKIYPFFQRLILEQRNTKQSSVESLEFDVILFGCNRIGFDFIDSFDELGDKFLVVDYDPETIDKLSEMNVNSRYGDADDNEFLEELGLDKVKMIISTIPEFDTNQFLISKVKSVNKNAVIMVVSHDVDDAIGLYDSGATYVITPHFLGGRYASMLISKYGFEIDKFVPEKERHLKDLKKRQKLGHVTSIMPDIYR